MTYARRIATEQDQIGVEQLGVETQSVTGDGVTSTPYDGVTDAVIPDLLETSDWGGCVFRLSQHTWVQYYNPDL